MLLFKFRMESQLSQKNMAKHLGITREHLGLIERGLRYPKIELLQRMAEFMSIDHVELYINITENYKKKNS